MTSLKELLSRRKRVFRELLKSTQKNRNSKEVYRKKLERKPQKNNIRDVWLEMKKITDFKQTEDYINGSLETANELNAFFLRFSSGTNSSFHPPLTHNFPFKPQGFYLPPQS